jgi:hypothetical protein
MTLKSLMIGAVSTAIALGASVSIAQAQDWSLNPTYGSVNLRSGFTPDPYVINMQSGGPIDASRSIGGNCRGFIANAPDYRVTYQAGNWPISFMVIANADTTLVVNGPDGQWYCDDDGGEGLNPLLQWGSPPSGQYDVYVGTYGDASLQPAQLIITELTDNSASNSSGPDWSLNPTYGSTSLSAGFTPDPYVVSLQSGGPYDSSTYISSSCRGFIAQAPDYRLSYNAGSWPLILSVDSAADTTLVVNGPDGQWYCDDDSGNGLNPSLRWNNPPSGQYDIYIGTYGDAGLRDALLSISEVSSN